MNDAFPMCNPRRKSAHIDIAYNLGFRHPGFQAEYVMRCSKKFYPGLSRVFKIGFFYSVVRLPNLPENVSMAWL